VERAKRVINERRDAIASSLTYKVPPGLMGELTEYTMTMLNHMPNRKTGAATPVQLITGRRAVPFAIAWGQPVFVYDNRKGERLAEKGIVINVRVSVVALSLKIWLPMRQAALYRSRNVEYTIFLYVRVAFVTFSHNNALYLFLFRGRITIYLCRSHSAS
jgi:hypothetical protein